MIARLARRVDGALLLELFTREGIGTMVSQDPLEQLRPASIDDVGGMIDVYNRRLNKPLSGFDTPHQFIRSWVYRLPFGKGPPRRVIVERYREGVLRRVGSGRPRTSAEWPAGAGRWKPRRPQRAARQSKSRTLVRHDRVREHSRVHDSNHRPPFSGRAQRLHP